MDLPCRHPVVLHVADAGESWPHRQHRGSYDVVTVGSLEAAERFLEEASADLAVVETHASDDARWIFALRRRLSSVPIVLIPRVPSVEPRPADGGQPPGSRPVRRPSPDRLPREVAEALADVLGLANGTHTADGVRPTPAPRSRLSPEIARTVEFLEANFWRDDISLGAAAKHAFMSRYHFSRTFRRETGVRYIDYLTRMRLETAVKLLEETSRSVTDICFDIGYNDLTHFERMFKRHVGTTPSEHRARGRHTRSTPASDETSSAAVVAAAADES